MAQAAHPCFAPPSVATVSGWCCDRAVVKAVSMICSSRAGGVGVSPVGWSGVIGFGAVLVMRRSSQVLRGARGAGGTPGWCCGMAVHTQSRCAMLGSGLPQRHGGLLVLCLAAWCQALVPVAM